MSTTNWRNNHTLWYVVVKNNKRVFITYRKPQARDIQEVEGSYEEALKYACIVQDAISAEKTLKWYSDTRSLVDRASELHEAQMHGNDMKRDALQRSAPVTKVTKPTATCVCCKRESSPYVMELKVQGFTVFTDTPHCIKCSDIKKQFVIEQMRKIRLETEGGIQTTMQFD